MKEDTMLCSTTTRFSMAILIALAGACDRDESAATENEPAEVHAEGHADHAAPAEDHADHAAAEHAEHADEHDGHGDHAEHALPPLEAADPSATLHDLPSAFTDPDGNTIRFADFDGHPTLVAMFYGSCTTVCPLILTDLQRIDEAVGSPSLRVAIATFDPERDTAERLTALRQERGMDAARWKLLRGDDDAVRDLAMSIGVQYRKLPDGEYAHSALIVLIDGEGHIVHRHEGLGRPLDEIIARARSLAGGEPTTAAAVAP
jgi:protein SCO1/2